MAGGVWKFNQLAAAGAAELVAGLGAGKGRVQGSPTAAREVRFGPGVVLDFGDERGVVGRISGGCAGRNQTTGGIDGRKHAVEERLRVGLVECAEAVGGRDAAGA